MNRHVVRIAIIAVALLASPAHAASQQTVLKLGGNWCEFYPEDVSKALMGVKGVSAVDMKSRKGFAVVTQDGSAKPDALVAAVNGVKSTDWFCTGEVSK
ncbi:MAG TPA: hypothetical protein VMT94_01160 [Burkholderiales bacterium]|nr:hypothetical protein [Burkholderiales bacterium]